MAIQFSEIQQQIINTRGQNVLVSASAGSGKTSVLVERLCRMVIADRISIDRILAMTFTEDAAAEMKTRLKIRLQQEDLQNPWIQKQLSLLETASISTIHGFCLNLVQQYYYQIPISYTMARHVDTDALDRQALSKAYQKALETLDSHRYTDLILYLQAFSKNEKDLQELILKFLEIAKTKPDPDAWIESCRHENRQTASWFIKFYDMRLEVLIDIFEELHTAMYDLEFSKAGAQQEWIHLFEAKISRLKEARSYLLQGKYKIFGKLFLEYLEQTGKVTPKINKVSFEKESDDSRSYEKQIAETLFYTEQFDRFEASAEPLKSTFIDLALATRTFFQQEKKKQEFIDFSDMEQFSLQLLNTPAICQEVQNRYDAILVDEYQDTNDLQEALISRIARENNVFRVGDVKQSIYGFRQARPALMRDWMKIQDASHKVLVMDENFRSGSHIIEFNNVFFSELMNTPGMESQFSAQDAASPGTESQKQEPQAPVRFLYTCFEDWEDPSQDGKTNLNHAKSVHKAYRIDLIAKDIQEKLLQGYQYRDIAILSRASTSHDDIKKGLEAYGIPSITKAKKGFYVNQAIQIVTSALKALNNPRDDIALTAMLCSPLGRVSQNALLQAASGRNEGYLYDSIRNHPTLMKSYREMEEWKSLPVGELIQKIYGYNDFYNRYTYPQDKTNLDLLLERASRLEDETSLSAFLEQLSLEEDFKNTNEAIPFGKEADVVKVNTIHSSKGLQYKVVYILCEETNKDNDAGSPVYLDPDLGLSFMGLSENRRYKTQTRSHIAFETKRFLEDQNEKMRLLYVAATRAEKELVFVDALKNTEAYSHPMNMRAILNNKGFSSWFFHICQNTRLPHLVLDKKEGISPRPEKSLPDSSYYSPKTYKGPVVSFFSQTASETKKQNKWRPVAFDSHMGKERGTLFHEMAQKLPYPYTEKAAGEYAVRHGLSLSRKDIDEFLALNDSPLYRSWMALPHEFECPYAVKENQNLLHGFMDMLVFDGKDIHILDFKTDTLFEMSALEKRYAGQLKTYQNALQTIYPDKTIRIWLYSFFLKEFKEITS